MFRGSATTNGSVTLNTQSSLVLGCVATSRAVLVSAGAPAVFVITKGSVLTGATGVAMAAGAVQSIGSFAGGTVLYDSINGNTAGYDHILTSSTITATSVTGLRMSGYLTMYIPSVAQSDAGLYFCNWYDGSALVQTATQLGLGSGYFSLTVTTKSGSGSTRNSKSNLLEYSLAFFAATKLQF